MLGGFGGMGGDTGGVGAAIAGELDAFDPALAKEAVLDPGPAFGSPSLKAFWGKP